MTGSLSLKPTTVASDPWPKTRIAFIVFWAKSSRAAAKAKPTPSKISNLAFSNTLFGSDSLFCFKANSASTSVQVAMR